MARGPLVVAGDTAVLIDWQQTGRILVFDQAGGFLSGRPVTEPDGTSFVPAPSCNAFP